MPQTQLFDTVAIDPALTRDQLVCLTLKYKFGLMNGRIIAGLPRDWHNFALQQINKIEDEILKKRLKGVLQQLDLSGAILPKDVPFDRKKAWVEVIKAETSKTHFNVLICDEPVEHDPLYSSSEIDEYIEESENKVGFLDVSQLTTPDSFIPLLNPFLKKHKKIVLVNRHQWLQATAKERDLFQTVFKHWAAQGGNDFTVIRSSLDSQYEPRPFSSRWSEETKELEKFLLASSYSGTFRFIAVNDQTDRLHHRYLLGNYCGISMDYGLEINSKPHPWQLLNQAHFKAARERFFVGDIQTEYPEHHIFLYRENGNKIVRLSN
ncbi:hypothetical protein AOB54_02845 [beta proteobacterium MWH-UniP1]